MKKNDLCLHNAEMRHWNSQTTSDKHHVLRYVWRTCSWGAKGDTYCIRLGKASWERSTLLGLENWMKFESENRKKSILDKNTVWVKAQRCEGRMCIKSRVLPRHGLSEELSTLPQRLSRYWRRRAETHQWRQRLAARGGRGMLSLAKVLFKIFEPISKIRFHLKIQISGFFWNLKDLGTQAVLFQDGSWLELKNSCLFSVECYVCLPYTELSLLLPAP